MKIVLFVGALAGCLISSSCSASNPSDDGQSISRSSPSAATSSSLSGVKKGMAYADFRQAIVAQGWAPTVDAKCKANVVGDDYKAQCANGSDSCKACDELPELSACSGDASCVMNFHDAAAKRNMEVGTYGDIKDRSTHGDSSQLDVTSWKISSAQSH
jgi:hypothetical protein